MLALLKKMGGCVLNPVFKSLVDQDRIIGLDELIKRNDKVYMKDLTRLKVIKIGNLIAYGTYSESLSRYKNVINFKAGDKVVSLCTVALCPGPFRIILDTYDLDEIESFSLSENELILNNEIRLTFTSQLLYRQPRMLPALIGTAKNVQLTTLMDELLEQDEPSLLEMIIKPRKRLDRFQSELTACFLKGIEAHWKKDDVSFVKQIQGRGMGSTPSGDDFLIGYLIGLSWMIEAWGMDLKSHREIVYQTALGSNPLINTFLYQACSYQLDRNWADFLNSFADNRVNRLMDDFYRIMDLGESSGTDMMSGFYFLIVDKLTEQITQNSN